MEANVGLGLKDGRHLVDDLKHGVGQIVGHVHAALTHPGEGDQLPVPGGDPLVSADANHGIVGGVGMYPEALEHFLTELTVHALIQGLDPQREEKLVDATKGYTGPRIVLHAHDQHVGEPEGLEPLPEGLGRLPRDQGQVLGHLLQLAPAGGVGLCLD